MKMTVLAAAAVLAVAAPVALTAAPANAATKAHHNPPCLTRAEFNRIHQGQSLPTVAKIVGSKGRVSLGSSFMTIREFTTCTAFHVSNVSFQHGRVVSKLYI